MVNHHPRGFTRGDFLGHGPLTCREAVGLGFSGFSSFGFSSFFRFFIFSVFYFLTNFKVEQNLKLSKFQIQIKFQSKQKIYLSKFQI
jgi:hypothetical protein